MAFIEFRNVTKSFGDNVVLNNINLSMDEGQLITLLGPSGCGKSTLLRCLAGLEELTSGQILLDGKDITNLPIQKRGIGMVFQQYSLFPNMNVYDNIAFGLKLAKMDKSLIHQKVTQAIELVNLIGKEKSYPNELSGGQQQRVALARSIVHEPKVLLLDEPLSAIDAKLRKSLQERIRNIQQRLKITTIFVTHDQDEAMIMSDCIHLFNSGHVEQTGSPVEMYTSPKTKFVAEFIGNYNILTRQEIDKILPNHTIQSEYVAIRPETLSITLEKPEAIDSYVFEGVISKHLSHGNVLRYTVFVEEVKIHVDVLFRSFQLFEDNQKIYLSIEKHNVLEVADEPKL